MFTLFLLLSTWAAYGPGSPVADHKLVSELVAKSEPQQGRATRPENAGSALKTWQIREDQNKNRGEAREIPEMIANCRSTPAVLAAPSSRAFPSLPFFGADQHLTGVATVEAADDQLHGLAVNDEV